MNRLLALLLFVPSLCLAQLPNGVPTGGLVAWYSFNGNAEDQSGNGHHGVVSGASPSIDENDAPSGSYFFDGNARIDIDDHDDFDWVEMTILITYQDFDNPAAYPNGNSNMVSKVPGSGWGSGFGFGLGGDMAEFGRCMTTTSGNECLAWGENEYGEWRTVAYTHSIDSVKVYFDAFLVYSEEASGGFINNDLPITIGMRGNGWHEFIGSISRLAFWNRALTEAEIQALLLGEAPEYGCTDPAACNYDDTANVDDGSCEHGCLFCGEGTVWDSASSTCVPAILSGDIAEDCTMMNLQELAQNHLLLVDQLESCGTGPWSCGDPVTFWNYNYPTTAIGDQCWFSENVRTTQYLDGSAIQEVTDGATWSGLSTGGRCGFDNSEANVSAYGYLYNWHAVNQSSGLCPAGWHVPTDDEWTDLEAYVTSEGFVGTEGTALKAASGWDNNANGSNDFGFSGLPGGYRNTNTSGDFDKEGELGWWWSSTPDGSNAWYRDLSSNSVLDRTLGNPRYGFSVRCVKD